MNEAQFIYQDAMKRGVPDLLARLLVAQAQHETGNFTSNFFKKYNNAFGYSYYAGSDWQLPAGGTIADNGQPIAAYASVADSVGEVVAWIRRRIVQGKFPAMDKITSPEQYAKLLKDAGYYGDTLANYQRALVKFFGSAGQMVSENKDLIFVTTLVLAGVVYYIYKDN